MLKLLIFLSVLGILKECTADEEVKAVKPYNLPIPYDYGDKCIKNLEQQMENLSENFRLRLDMLRLDMNLLIDQQIEIIKERFIKIDKNSKRNAERDITNTTTESLIDLGGGFTDTTKESRSTNNSNSAAQRRLPANCAEATAVTRKSGSYNIQVDRLSLHPQPFLAVCDEETQGGGWTVIQRRFDGSVDFYRNWTDYKVGFGNLDGEFFIGLDRLHALITDTPQELLVVLQGFKNVTKFAKYAAFAIGNEAEAYALKLLGKYTGDAGDSLRIHESQKWTTRDVDNDLNTYLNCAVKFVGAWWYNGCHSSNLNGQYLQADYAKRMGKGIEWVDFSPSYTLKSVKMMIRPQRID